MLEFSRELGIDSFHCNRGTRTLVRFELSKQIEATDYEKIFRHKSRRVLEFGENLEAGAREFEVAFDGLVVVSDAAHNDELTGAIFPDEFGARQFGNLELTRSFSRTAPATLAGIVVKSLLVAIG